MATASALMAMGLTSAANAQDGALDPSFGIGGKVIFDLGGADDALTRLALQADKKVLALGSGRLVRFDEDGWVDQTFGVNGVVDLRPTFGSMNGLAVQPDNQIVLAGSDENGEQVMVLRLRPNGALDPTFGNGSGFVTTDIVPGTNETALAVAVRRDGKIVAAGHVLGDFTVVRYQKDGSLDLSFDGDGHVVTPIGPDPSTFDAAHALTFQPDAKLVAAGTSFSEGFVVVRYEEDGSLDPSFDGDGIVTTNVPNSLFAVATGVVAQDDGAILITGENGALTGIVVRYLPGGQLDPSFGPNGDGIVTSFRGRSNDIALQRDGKIVIVGTVFGGMRGDMALARFNTDGSPDSTFGNAGVVKTDFSTGQNRIDEARAVAIRRDGRIVVGGLSVPPLRMPASM